MQIKINGVQLEASTKDILELIGYTKPEVKPVQATEVRVVRHKRMKKSYPNKTGKPVSDEERARATDILRRAVEKHGQHKVSAFLQTTPTTVYLRLNERALSPMKRGLFDNILSLAQVL